MALLPLLASASAWSPTPEGHEHEAPSFTTMVSLMASETLRPSAAATAAQQTAEAPSSHMAHVVGRHAVALVTTAVEQVPSYLIAAVMVLVVVLIFALFWCAAVLCPACRVCTHH